MTMAAAKKCDECDKRRSNVGPWEDGRQLCGPCKAAVWRSGGGPERLKAELERVLATEPKDGA